MASIISAGTTSGTALNMAGDTSGVLQLATNGSTTAVTVDASQNVGIGTTSPSSFDSTGNKLVVGTGSGNQGLSIYAGTTGYASINFADGTTGADRYTGQISYYHTDNALLFATNGGTERMRIDSSGNVGIGATTLTAKLHVVSDGATTIPMRNNNTETGTASSNSMAFQRSGTTVGLISVTGSNTTYGTSSDYRLKENIVPMTGALATVQALKPVTYKWKIDGSDGQGFIAHELQAVVPDCVTGEKDAVETYTDEEGNEQIRIKPQGIDTSFLVATLTAAIQEQQTIINDLKARIETLEAK